MLHVIMAYRPFSFPFPSRDFFTFKASQHHALPAHGTVARKSRVCFSLCHFYLVFIDTLTFKDATTFEYLLFKDKTGGYSAFLRNLHNPGYQNVMFSSSYKKHSEQRPSSHFPRLKALPWLCQSIVMARPKHRDGSAKA